jgi:hypothetical protein
MPDTYWIGPWQRSNGESNNLTAYSTITLPVFENLSGTFYFSSSAAPKTFGPFGGTVMLLWPSYSQLRSKKWVDWSWYEVDEL